MRISDWSSDVCSSDLITALAVLMQQRVLKGRSFVTVSGKAFKPRLIDLGKWKYLTLGISVIYLVLAVVLPALALLIGAFRNFLYILSITSIFDASAYSLSLFSRLFSNSLTLLSLWNTLKLGAMTALVGGLLSFSMENRR